MESMLESARKATKSALEELVRAGDITRFEEWGCKPLLFLLSSISGVKLSHWARKHGISHLTAWRFGVLFYKSKSITKRRKVSLPPERRSALGMEAVYGQGPSLL